MTRGEKAIALFAEGYNCTQAVVLSFADKLPYDKDVLAKLASPFGGGMGRLREVCGAVSGTFIVLGLLEGYASPETGDVKTALYQKVQALAKSFEEKHGSLICRELLGIDDKHSSPEPTPRTADFYHSRPCPQFIGACADLLEEHFQSNNP